MHPLSMQCQICCHSEGSLHGHISCEEGTSEEAGGPPGAKGVFQLYMCACVYVEKQFQEFERKFLHKKRKTAEVFVLADNLTNKMEFEPLPLPYNEPDRLEVGTEE